MLYRNTAFKDRQGRVFTGDIRAEDGIITDIDIISEGGEDPVLPPFVDIHIHGGFGVDIMTASAQEICFLSKKLYEDNVGAYMPTTAASSRENILRAVRNIYKASKEKRYAEIAGIHIEGPFISQKYKGIMEEKYITPCDTGLYDDIKSICPDMPIRFTVAPECEGAEEFCRYVTANGGLVSIGHSGADRELCERLCSAGAGSYTHTFNAMSPLHHRTSSVTEAALTGREYAELICDFVHVSRGCAELLERLKGDRIILVTDAMHAMGCGKGEYIFCGKRVYCDGTSVKDTSGRLAGSVLTMKRAYENMSEISGEKNALRMASENPSALLGLERYGCIDKGKRIII